MNRHIMPIAAIAFALLGGAFTATAAAQDPAPKTCELVAQPWDGRSYALTAVIDGTPQALISRQSGLLDGQTRWEFPADSITEVWWAAKDPSRQTVASDFYDVMPVVDCRFTVAYHAMPGKQDSVAIRAVVVPVTTTTTAPTTTTTGPEVTTTTGPTTTTTAQVTTTTGPDQPTTTTAPDQPTTTTSTTTGLIIQSGGPTTTTTAPVGTTTTAPFVKSGGPTPEFAGKAGNPDLPATKLGSLPFTGSNVATLGMIGIALVALGYFLVMKYRRTEI